MSGTLYVVATPIGNLEDITLRALRILREVSVIAAEDTRRTARLLHHHGISTAMVSFHEHNTSRRLPEIMTRLVSGSSVALVSDAGTPLLSDPGLELVRACIAQDIPVDPIPGASAPLAALVASGFPANPVTVLGFPPIKASAREEWFSRIAMTPHTSVFFESPHRIRATLEAAGRFLGKRPLVVARELTKLHQEFLRGTAEDLVFRLMEPRGEFTVVVGPGPQAGDHVVERPSASQIADEFGRMTDSRQMTRRQAIGAISKRYQLSAREVYAVLESRKKPVS